MWVKSDANSFSQYVQRVILYYLHVLAFQLDVFERPQELLWAGEEDKDRNSLNAFFQCTRKEKGNSKEQIILRESQRNIYNDNNNIII